MFYYFYCLALPFYKGRLTRELHAFHAPCWGQNVITSIVYPRRNQHCKVWSDLTNSLPFLVRPEYTLSLIWLIKPSFKTHNRLLSGPSPCSIITSLGAWLRITQFFTFLPLGTTINRVLLKCFHNKMVVKTLEGLPVNLVMSQINQ